MAGQEPQQAEQPEEAMPRAEQHPDIVRLDAENDRRRQEMNRMWETIGQTREELVAVRSSVDGVRSELHDFRGEIRTSVSGLTDSVKALTESLSHHQGKAQGKRDGSHRGVTIAVSTAGVTLTLVGVVIAFLRFSSSG